MSEFQKAIAAAFLLPDAPNRKRYGFKPPRKSLKEDLIDTIAGLTESDWERYSNNSRLKAIDDCACDLIKIIRRHQRRAAAAKKGT